MRGTRPGVVVPVGVVLLALLLPATGTTPAPEDYLSPEAVSNALEKTLDASFQQELPRSPDGDPDVWRPTILVLPSAVMQVLWIVLAVLVLLALVRAFVLPQDPEAEDDSGSRSGEDDLLRDLPLPDHQALAASGHYGQAIRVLLLRTIVLLARRLRVPLPESLTSREVLARVGGGSRHEDLSRLVRSVEVGHFGGVEPDAAEYAHCLDVYERIRGDRGAKG